MLEIEDDSDEVEQFLHSSPVQEKDALKFWLQRKDQFPYLSKIALKILSMPTSSASIERTFSKAKEILGEKQLRTGDDLLESRMKIIGNKNLFLQFYNDHWLEYFPVNK